MQALYSAKLVDVLRIIAFQLIIFPLANFNAMPYLVLRQQFSISIINKVMKYVNLTRNESLIQMTHT